MQVKGEPLLQMIVEERGRRPSTTWIPAPWQQIVEATVGTADHAMGLTEQHGLRGYDAVHLGADMALQAVRRVMQLPPLASVSSDAQQLRAAVAEGFPVEDLDQYL